MPDNLTPTERMRKSLNDTFFRSTDPDKQKKDGDIYRLPIVKMVPFFKHIFRLYTGNYENMLKKICPSDKAYLKEILNPSENRIYTYKMNFKNWLFCSKRKDHLYEITNV